MSSRIINGIYYNDEEFCLKNGISVKDIKENFIFGMCKCDICSQNQSTTNKEETKQ